MLTQVQKHQVALYDKFVEKNKNLCKEYHTLIKQQNTHNTFNLVSENIMWYVEYTYHRENLMKIILDKQIQRV